MLFIYMLLTNVHEGQEGDYFKRHEITKSLVAVDNETRELIPQIYFYYYIVRVLSGTADVCMKLT